jgi:hypothetical protein
MIDLSKFPDAHVWISRCRMLEEQNEQLRETMVVLRDVIIKDMNDALWANTIEPAAGPFAQDDDEGAHETARDWFKRGFKAAQRLLGEREADLCAEIEQLSAWREEDQRLLGEASDEISGLRDALKECSKWVGVTLDGEGQANVRRRLRTVLRERDAEVE